MRACLLSSAFLWSLLLPAMPAAAGMAPLPQPPARQAAALWLTQQLHRQVDASQVLVSPDASKLEGCTVTRASSAPTGATALSLRCPAHVLPQLVLLKMSLNEIPLIAAAALPRGAEARKAPPLVRAGAALKADWRTAALHAELPVVALDSGAAGAEIRVRAAHSSRILRARILTAHTVTILAEGV